MGYYKYYSYKTNGGATLKRRRSIHRQLEKAGEFISEGEPAATYSVRDFMWLILVVAIASLWYVDSQRMKRPMTGRQLSPPSFLRKSTPYRQKYLQLRIENDHLKKTIEDGRRLVDEGDRQELLAYRKQWAAFDSKVKNPDGSWRTGTPDWQRELIETRERLTQQKDDLALQVGYLTVELRALEAKKKRLELELPRIP